MPTDAASPPEARTATTGDAPDLIKEMAPPKLSRAAQKRGLRLALGASASFSVAILAGWPLATFSTVFVVLFLQGPAPMPGRAMWKLFQTAFVFLAFSWMLSSALLAYPVPYLMAIATAVALSFYWSTTGAGTLGVVLALMSALMIPNLVITSRELSLILVAWIPLNLFVAWLWTVLMFTLIPPIPLPSASAKSAGPPPDPARLVLRMSLVTIPFAMLFFLSGSGMIVTLLFVALLSMQLAAATGAGPKVAKGMLMANVIGGIAAIIAYELTVIAPLMLTAMLAFTVASIALARWFVSERADASLAGTSMSTLVILFGGSIAPFGDDADVKMFDRLYQIGFALAFVLLAYLVVNAFLPTIRAARQDAQKSNLKELTRKKASTQRAGS
ncbi:DUF2955 domain-containing protein [Shimia abyssi]|uniref:DUF2955 family protein n=1 Tax=Shimia abyssi TaxID=1662395 RepID=A0A2P8F9I7_9RHOB|nr:DUF2955 domain-containing protein [Shimia abyssi]PSL18358.1 Protein of unknown function (DUF2955) [Shimia abyssi]